VLGVAVLAAVFANRGGYQTPGTFANRGGYQTPGTFVHGLAPALTIGAITVAIGAAAALLIPPRHRATATALKPAVEAA
jgi:hypothetical protein